MSKQQTAASVIVALFIGGVIGLAVLSKEITEKRWASYHLQRIAEIQAQADSLTAQLEALEDISSSDIWGGRPPVQIDHYGNYVDMWVVHEGVTYRFVIHPNGQWEKVLPGEYKKVGEMIK